MQWRSSCTSLSENDSQSDTPLGSFARAGAVKRAITFPTLPHSNSLSLLFPAIAQAQSLPLLQPMRLRLARAGRSGLADAWQGGAIVAVALRVLAGVGR
jgi:hypothetical protein